MKKLLIPIAAIVLSAAVLFGASFALSGIAKENGKKEHLQIMQSLLPGSTEFILEPYTGDDPNIVSVHRNGEITGLVVREMHETFGLGAQALTNVDFLAGFLMTSGDAALGENVDGISGATVTSRAIARAVNSAAAYVTGETPSGGVDASTGATS